MIEEAGRSQFGAVLYRTTELFLKLFGLNEIGELPNIEGFDPSPEFVTELRERLLKAGEARAGIAGVTEAATGPVAAPAEPEPADSAPDEPEPADSAPDAEPA